MPKLAAIVDGAEPDVLVYETFPREHRDNSPTTG